MSSSSSKSDSSQKKTNKVSISQVIANIGLSVSDISTKSPAPAEIQGEAPTDTNEGAPLAGSGPVKLKSYDFKPGDTVRVHARIVEGNKERIQVFEGVVIKRHKRNQRSATFTVRKISYSVGVERTFLLHSPRIERIEVVSRGIVRRARLFYLRDTVGKAGRIKTDRSAIEDAGDSSESSEEVGGKSGSGNGAGRKANSKASSAEASSTETQPAAA